MATYPIEWYESIIKSNDSLLVDLHKWVAELESTQPVNKRDLDQVNRQIARYTRDNVFLNMQIKAALSYGKTSFDCTVFLCNEKSKRSWCKANGVESFPVLA